MTRRPLTTTEINDAVRIWNYHQMHHLPRACSAAICLGGPDPGIPDLAVELFRRELFPVVVFTGANSPDTVEWYPEGEALGLRERAIELGIPEASILVETEATNTGQNIELSRKVLADAGIAADTVMLVSMPYMQRRAYATCKKTWPEVDVVCASESIGFDTYADRIGDPPLAADMIVGDLQRIMLYPDRAFAIEQDVPPEISAAFQRLVEAGYTSRLAQG